MRRKEHRRVARLLTQGADWLDQRVAVRSLELETGGADPDTAPSSLRQVAFFVGCRSCSLSHVPRLASPKAPPRVDDPITRNAEPERLCPSTRTATLVVLRSPIKGTTALYLVFVIIRSRSKRYDAKRAPRRTRSNRPILNPSATVRLAGMTLKAINVVTATAGRLASNDSCPALRGSARTRSAEPPRAPRRDRQNTSNSQRRSNADRALGIRA